MDESSLILVVGAGGVIGGALLHHLQQAGHRVIGTTRRKSLVCAERLFLDLEKPISDWDPPAKFSVAYICAAETSTQNCAANPKRSYHINVDQSELLAKALIDAGSRVVFLSTNLVYNGSTPYQRSEEAVCPQTEYGHQKAQAEKRLLTLGNGVTVVRMTKVLSSHMPLLKEWSQSLLTKEPIHPFLDMVLSPVSLDFAVNALSRLINVDYAGIIQISGPEDITYAELAIYLAQKTGADSSLVQPISAKDVRANIESLPVYSTLDVSSLKETLGLTPPSVWAAVDSALSDLVVA